MTKPATDMNKAKHCDQCAKPVSSHDTVILADETPPRALCSRCFNEWLAQQWGLDYEHPHLPPLTFEDRDGVRHDFEFQPRVFQDGFAIDAVEIRGGEAAGYKFSALGGPEEDLMELFRTLYQRLLRELGRRHVEETPDGLLQITQDDTVRGIIGWDADQDVDVPFLVVDGREVTWKEMGRMVTNYEGFHFKLEIFDPSEER